MEYKVNGVIHTKKWKYPHTILCVYKNYVVAASKANALTNYLILDLDAKIAYMGSSRYKKYNLISEKKCREFIDKVIGFEIKLATENSCPIEFIIKEV